MYLEILILINIVTINSSLKVSGFTILSNNATINSSLNVTNQYAKPTPRGDQAADPHTVKAPAPSLSLGGGLIYGPRCCSRSGIEHSWVAPRGACACVCGYVSGVRVVRVGCVVCVGMWVECGGGGCGGVASVCVDCGGEERGRRMTRPNVNGLGPADSPRPSRRRHRRAHGLPCQPASCQGRVRQRGDAAGG